jgi:DNA-binding MarR family transcriptional regulator
VTKNSETDKGTVDADFALWRFLDRTRYVIFRQREKELSGLGVTPEQAQVLDILRANNGITTINEIVRMTQLQHHSVSTLIDRMSKQGLVTKIRTQHDKRVLKIMLTDKGSLLFSEIPIESVKKAFSCLSDDEKRHLRGYLDRLLAHAYDLAKEKEGS